MSAPDFNSLSEFHRVEHSVATAASPELCWQTYIDWNNWPKFHNSYGEMRWIKGAPWTVGSELDIEITTPVNFHVRHVITSVAAGDHIAWIDHSGFITIEQWVFFRAQPEGGTLVETWADLVGGSTIKGILALPLFKVFTERWYGEFGKYCDRLAAK